MRTSRKRRLQGLSVLAAASLAAVAIPTAASLTAQAAAVRYEAENSPATCAGTIDSNHAGHSGSGFCNSDNAVGAASQFTVNASTAGNATLAIRYAHGATDTRSADIVVNGTTVQSASAFSATGAWTTWSTKTVTVPLNAGSNTVRLVATTGAGLANIDYVELDDGAPPQQGDGRYEVEALNRGVTVVPSGGGNLVSWRLLGTDASNVAFNVYRGSTKLNSSPITGATNYLDTGGSSSSQYTVRAVTDGTEGTASGVEARFNSSGYLDIPIQQPSGSGFTYEANDASVGDLDGDGDYEYIVKWYPSNAKDNSQSGTTGNTIIDAYELDGTRLWRIDLGRNIRSGAHYTQFQVFDYDGDGKAEIAMKTADGTRDGQGTVIGSSSADHRNSGGYVLSGPEFLTIFNGQTGAAMDTVDYDPPRGNVSSWGDDYGNRVDRFLAGTAYLDGETPSMIFARGYYTRSVIWAVDWNGTDLTTRWTFDSDDEGSQYEGQGAHSLSIADLNGDGRQDIVYGAMAIGSDGNALWNSRMGHGDALHVSDFVPSRSGQEVFMVHESSSAPSSSLLGSNGSVLFQTSPDGDNGRGVAANVLSSNAGAEYWSSNVSGLLNSSGSNIGSKPASANFLAWWDGDGERELLDGTQITNYPSGTQLSASGVATNNGTKSNPSLSADLFGDWREEVVWRTSDNRALRIYATPHQTNLRIATLMHDVQYRVAIAWQNTAYNQPPHPSFYIGSDVTGYPWPDVRTP
ncbi:carbohydrate-binding protein [Glycomyces sp. A-F 0318]|uniref:rhamnogalacturonan lyase family protein n=1 Tax=Glycomyces amatae TaxID=2881355 RepID=UPI001E5C7940|nr:carbohydrate-binding protein [Glycomyces amatae]MCD0447245.1 carbohydrate-binding protein [Glycomyces amatae]